MLVHNLTDENYYSKEMDLKYFSVSQFKNFDKCSAKALHDLQFDINETKEAYVEGQLFEALTIGDKDLFFAKHPEMISSQGPTKGQLKANYKIVVKAAERFNQQEFFRKIIDRSQKQVILTGTINGIEVKGRIDLLDLDDKLIPDTKCMANFNDQYDKKEKCYKPWYYAYDYVLQLAIYQELVKQNYGIKCKTCLFAATKEETPDLASIMFDDKLLEIELERFGKNVIYFDNVKRGKSVPISCGICDYCKSTKIIEGFTEVK